MTPSLFDHTLLKPEMTSSDVKRICKEAMEWGCASVFVLPHWIPLAAELLQHSSTAAGAPIGFPLGAHKTSTKVAETQQAISDGAKEVDMVMTIGLAKEGKWKELQKDIQAVVEAAEGSCVKVILETCLLEEDEIRKACEAVVLAGAQFVKSSTGLNREGATPHVIQLMASSVPQGFGIKASGGIRTLEQVEALLQAGATRIGTSSTGKIIDALFSKK